MTGDIKVGFLENFAINNWYRFVAYIGAIVLILSLFLEPKGIQIEDVRGFAIWSILTGLSLWIIKDIIDKIYTYFERQHEMIKDELEEKEKTLAVIWGIVNIGSFIRWIFILLSLFS